MIDASVVFESKPPEAMTPRRACLMTILKICHRMVMTPALRGQWKEHASPYAWSWQTQMVSKRKWDYVREVPEIEGLRNAIGRTRWDQGRKEKAEEDMLLVDAALCSDNVILSCDDKARRNFGELAAAVSSLGKIVWVNPRCPGEDCIGWLERGAPDEPSHMLGAASA